MDLGRVELVSNRSNRNTSRSVQRFARMESGGLIAVRLRWHRAQVGCRSGGARVATWRRLVVQERLVEWAPGDWAIDSGQWKRVLGSKDASGNRRLRHQVPQPDRRGLGMGW